MAVPPGTKFGPYEIRAALGAGGMGEVYRAHDSRLHRDVAIKVLPEGLSSDPDRRARLEREAQAVAALSHPNVLAIFDTGVHDGKLFVVTELLEGETLRHRLATGPLPLRRAIEVGVEVARGLAAAHGKQLVHRDLKPENIFLLTDGHAKILDFGLARQATSAAGATETVAAVTDPGTVLGTVGYMAPEQVRNEPLDARADLFAFGAVLYEMLTGQRAFRRDTPAETMTAILREEPQELLRVRSDLPPALDRIVRHCLEKNPGERFQTARDVAFALEALSGSDATSAIVAGVPGAASRKSFLPWLIAGLAIVGLVAFAVYFGMRSASGRDSGGVSVPIAVGATTQVTTEDGLEIDPSLSPDGKLLAYAAGSAVRMRIFIRSVAGGRTIQLTEGADAVEFQPRWSPDGERVLYLTATGVFVAPKLGGASQRVASGAISAAAWAPDGKRLVISRSETLAIAPLDGGAEHVIGSHTELYSCDWSRHGDWIACAYGNPISARPGTGFGNIAPSAITVVSAAGGAFTDVTDNARLNQSPVWSPDGRELYFISNRQGPRDLYVIDITTGGRPEGDPRRVTTGLGAQAIAFSATGEHLAYVAYTARANIWSVPIPSTGSVDTTTARPITNGNQVIEAMQVSRDGRWLVYDSTLAGNADIFRVPIGGGSPEPLTSDPADEFAPSLSPDGRLVAYHSFRGGTRDIFIKPVEGGPVEQVTATPGQESYPVWSPNGQAIAFLDQATKGGVLVTGRLASGGWGEPIMRRAGAGPVSWLDDAQFVCTRAPGILEVVNADSGAARIVYDGSANPADPHVERSVVVSADGRSVYFKNHDSQGRAAIWSVPLAGGRPRLMVQFSELSRPSVRPDFAAGAGQFFFTLDDRQSDIWVAQVSRRR